MVIYVIVLLVEYCDTHLVSWTDHADKVRNRCGQENELSEYGNVLLLSQLALDLTG
jgi:hypothetical protein